MVLTETRKGLKDGFFGFSKAEIIFELIFSMKQSSLKRRRRRRRGGRDDLTLFSIEIVSLSHSLKINSA